MATIQRLKVWKVEVDGQKYRLAIPENYIITHAIEQAVVVHNAEFKCSAVETAVSKVIDTGEIVLVVSNEV